MGARQRRSDEFAGIAHSPAFVYCHEDLCRAASALQRIAARADCTLLYSIKACGLASVLEVLAPYVGGLAASSLFEARLAREALRGSGSVHLFTVGVTSEEIDEVAELSDYISLNSLSQLRRYGPLIRSRAKCGLRVNPGMSYVADERYDPCRRHSKLGVPIDGLLAALGADPVLMAGVYGLLIHTNCDSNDLGELLETLEHLDARLGNVLAMMQWVNLGGGYLFEEGDRHGPVLPGRRTAAIEVWPGGVHRNRARRWCVVPGIWSPPCWTCSTATARR